MRAPRSIIEEPITTPESLEFERSTYRLSLHREKSIELRAPSEVVAASGRAANVSSSAPGIVVRTPLVELALDEKRDFWTAAVRVEGRALGTNASIVAALGDRLASTLVSVVRKEEGPSFRVQVVDEDMGNYRAIEAREQDANTGEDVRIIKVSGRHPALRKILAELTLRSPEARLVVAEAVTDAAVRYVVNQLYRLRRGLEEFTSERLYLEHYRRVKRLLPRAQTILLEDLVQVSGLLEDVSGNAEGSAT